MRNNPYQFLEDDEDDPRKRGLEAQALSTMVNGGAPWMGSGSSGDPEVGPSPTPPPPGGPLPPPPPAPPPPATGGGVTEIPWNSQPWSEEVPGGVTGAPAAKPPRVPGSPVSPTTPRAPAVPGAGKRDAWSGKGTVTARGDFGRMEGFDQKNWDDDGMQTAKYQAGRIFSRFDPDDRNVLSAIMADPEFKALFPGAKMVGPDKIDFGDGLPVDVIRGHGAPGAKFAWQADGHIGTSGPPGGAEAAGPGIAGDAGTGGRGIGDALSGGTGGRGIGDFGGPSGSIGKILAEIEALQGGGVSQFERDALRKQLG